MIRYKEAESSEWLAQLRSVMTPYLDNVERKARSLREGTDYSKSLYVGIYWLKPGKWTPGNDDWTFIHVSKTPVENSDDINGVRMVATDHLQVWESLKPHGIVPLHSDYAAFPRGRIIVLQGGECCMLLGSWGFEDCKFTVVKPKLKRMLIKEFNLPANTKWVQDFHYTIPGMEPRLTADDDADDDLFDLGTPEDYALKDDDDDDLTL